MTDLVLYSTFEEISNEFSKSIALDSKLMEFIEPLPYIEEQINIIARSATSAGKLSFILGSPGTGKSTFLRSLSWKKHLGVAELVQVNANELTTDGINGLYEELAKQAHKAVSIRDKGPTCLIIDYLEYLDDFDPSDVKGFFRRLNGLLRNSPLLILWPVTGREDVDAMIDYSRAVSGTLFYRGYEVIEFTGPDIEKFKDIVSRTISVLNEGKDLAEFGLTFKDLEETHEALLKLPRNEATLREYIEIVKERWRTNNDYVAKLRSSIPKSTEVWFIFSYKDAERVISQFVRRADRVEDNWTAIHDKLADYIRDGQRSHVWSAARLQLALYGAIKTRIMFLPTNTLVSCVSSYTANTAIQGILANHNAPAEWNDKSKAKRTLGRSAVYKQLIGEVMAAGMRRGGPAAKALDVAEPSYSALVKWVSSSGQGSDKELNKCVALALAELGNYDARSDRQHPWIPDIIPDIFIDTPHKQICIEFNYTNKNEPYAIADYVLKKLNTYMNSLEKIAR
ncbi:ATP-binding protein [Stutzerimonas nitrititolerans]|uniref:ATP-binding protein n=1 Tax=Stutzerimonas nitrititolerans TaxID=2482751 RepID=A0AA41WNZ9_9GAMM|nr:ATP-binding protein [Stutzerimonas nitrititolerans]MCO7546068.1 ATP-binding protein [Stutzerimonas nitrititolerans]